MSDTTVGQLVNEGAERDAIHVAIAPVIAGERLSPGQHIGVVNEQALAGAPHIGIVDPFLAAPVFKGERFYLFLYPKTVTAMRHHWAHPAFGETTQHTFTRSELWLREFADRYSFGGYNGTPEENFTALMGRLSEAAEGRESCAVACGTSLYSGEVDLSELWDHYADFTGKQVCSDAREKLSFSCSC